MIPSMKSELNALMKTFYKQGFPYFAYCLGDKTRGICRIGKWEDIHIFHDGNREVVEKKKHNVTPNKMLKVVKTFSRWEREYVNFFLWLEPLPENEREAWRKAFKDIRHSEDVWGDNGEKEN